MKIRLYLFEESCGNENVNEALAEALKARDVDVLTSREVGMKGASDREQLEFATKKRRTILTHNKRDFAIIHKEYLREGKAHNGIILSSVYGSVWRCITCR